MAELFGYSIQRSNKDKGGEKTFSTPTPDDGTIDVAGGGFLDKFKIQMAENDPNQI